ncbi:putative nef attachable protein, partial [Chlamydia psittaci C6/98]
FRIPLKTIGTKEISTAKSEKEVFGETSLCSVNSSHRVTAFPSRSRSRRLFLENLQSDIWKPKEGYGEKG